MDDTLVETLSRHEAEESQLSHTGNDTTRVFVSYHFLALSMLGYRTIACNPARGGGGGGV